MSLETVIADFRTEIPAFIATDVVEMATGMSLGGAEATPEFDASVASASLTEIVKANMRALDLLGLDPHSTEDILITVQRVYILIRMLSPHYFHGVAIAPFGSLALARTIMRKYAPRLLDELRALR